MVWCRTGYGVEPYTMLVAVHQECQDCLNLVPTFKLQKGLTKALVKAESTQHTIQVLMSHGPA